MKHNICLTGVLTIAAGMANAGALERGKPLGADILFESGNLVEFSIRAVSPTVSGVSSTATSSGDVTHGYTQMSVAFRQEMTSKFTAALVFEQPYGANTKYPTSTYPLTGTEATAAANSITFLGKYKLTDNVSIFGGPRLQTFNAQASIPGVGGYTATTETDTGYGYVVGAAYEIPEIKLRASLTYASEITHENPTVEAGPAPGSSITTTTLPQSLTFDVQSGIAKDTLAFGSVHWVNWDGFAISPAGYVATTGGPLVSYSDDRILYTVGLGRRFNDTWSGAITAGYEPSVGGTSPNLSPIDGLASLGVGLTYTAGDIKISGGASYIWVGDANTRVAGPITGAFRDNSAVAVGLKFAFQL